jgi:hypothetical protein
MRRWCTVVWELQTKDALEAEVEAVREKSRLKVEQVSGRHVQ